MNGTLSFYNAGSVVGTLKPYLMKKNLFELFTLIGSEDAKNFRRKHSYPTVTIVNRSQHLYYVFWPHHNFM